MALRYEPVARLQCGLTGGVSAVAFDPDGTYITTAGMEDVKAYIWRVVDNKLLTTFLCTQGSILSLEWLQDQLGTLICGSQGGYIFEWKPFGLVCSSA